jgi:RNA polymerase sigma-70 factor (ECF subfamily)
MMVGTHEPGTDEPDTDQLLPQVEAGEHAAIDKLFGRHRARLRRMVALRMDRRLAGRVDPSDVVQEALADAARKLKEYLRCRPLPFYPWLRRLAWERLVQLRNRHIRVGKRSVAREEEPPTLAGKSADRLAERLMASGTSASQRLIRGELRERIKLALAKLPPSDRELLVLRYLEQFSPSDIATQLGISAAAASMRHLRALERLRELLGEETAEGKQ